MKYKALFQEDWKRITKFWIYADIGITFFFYWISLANRFYDWEGYRKSSIQISVIQLPLIIGLSILLTLIFSDLFYVKEQCRRTVLWEKYKMLPISKVHFYFPKFAITAFFIFFYTAASLGLYIGIGAYHGYIVRISDIVQGISFIWIFGICFILCEWVGILQKLMKEQ